MGAAPCAQQDGMGQDGSRLPALSRQAEMQKSGSIVTVRPRQGKLSPAAPVAAFTSSSEEGSRPNTASKPGKRAVTAYLLCRGSAAQRGTLQTPWEAPPGTAILMNATLHPTQGFMLGWRPRGWLKHPVPWGATGSPGSQTKLGKSSATRSTGGKEDGHPPWQPPQPRHVLYPKPQTGTASEPEHGTAQCREVTAGNPRAGRSPLPAHGCPRGARGGYS